MDKWDRKTNFNCESCMFYVPKIEKVPPDRADLAGRCRRNAPTMKGYPVVYASDWCGEHKIGSNLVRDERKVDEYEKATESKLSWRTCPICNYHHISRENPVCPQCHKDPKEKAKIKQEITGCLEEMICTDEENNYSHSERQELRKINTKNIKNLLEKL